MKRLLLDLFDKRVEDLSERYGILEAMIRMLVYQMAIGYNYKEVYPKVKGLDEGTIQSRMSFYHLVKGVYYTYFFDDKKVLMDNYKVLRGFIRFKNSPFGRKLSFKEQIKSYYGATY